ncbi:MAG: hypothetical protein WAM17_16495, partial [Rhodoplanes sp.]
RRDPAIHAAASSVRQFSMDRRVMPGGDEKETGEGNHASPASLRSLRRLGCLHSGRLQTLGERESGVARLEEAVAAYRDALEEFDKSGATYFIEVARSNLLRVGSLLTERRNSAGSTSG